MMMQAVLSNPSHPEYGVATIPFPINLDGTPPQRQFVNACRKIFEKICKRVFTNVRSCVTILMQTIIVSD